MKIILIDDEAAVRTNMKALLSRHAPECTVIGEAEGVQSGLALLAEQSPDLVFLDVEMQDGTGFDLLAQLEQPRFNIVFVTGHDRYALKAFKYSALDYMIKPVDPQEMTQALQRATSNTSQLRSQQLNNFMANQQRAGEDQKILLKDLETVYLVSIKDIIRCEAQNNYTIFCLTDGRKVTISVTLKEYERLFEEHHFLRVHQSHLINLQHFDRYDKKNGGIIHMKDGSQAPLAGRRKETLMKKLEELYQ